MIRNIIFIVLFLLICGGAYVFISNENGSTLTDRNEYGTFNGDCYECDTFSFSLDFKPEWLVFDGVSVKKAALEGSSETKLEEAYGESLDKIKFIVGAATPDAKINCRSRLNHNYTAADFSETGMRSGLEYMTKTIENMGGVIGGMGCQVLNTGENDNQMLMYYYDYTLNDDYVSTFICYTNSGSNSIVFEGNYNNFEGLQLLTDLMHNGFTLYTDSVSEA